ncbi:hypothetical protein Tco_1185024 [Tanacetum coccineum]
MMSDSSSGGLSDLDDIDDLEMIMQQVQAEQEQEEVERVRHRNYIYRERLDAEERLMADYFGPNPKYPEYYFRKRYRMSRKLFLEIVSGFSVIMKCTCAIRQLAYGVTPDSLDEYLQMGNHAARDSAASPSTRTQLDLLEQVTTISPSDDIVVISPHRSDGNYAELTIREKLVELVGDHDDDFNMRLGKKMKVPKLFNCCTKEKYKKAVLPKTKVSQRNDINFFATIGAFVLLPPIIILGIIIASYVQLFP